MTWSPIVKTLLKWPLNCNIRFSNILYSLENILVDTHNLINFLCKPGPFASMS